MKQKQKQSKIDFELETVFSPNAVFFWCFFPSVSVFFPDVGNRRRLDAFGGSARRRFVRIGRATWSGAIPCSWWCSNLYGFWIHRLWQLQIHDSTIVEGFEDNRWKRHSHEGLEFYVHWRRGGWRGCRRTQGLRCWESPVHCQGFAYLAVSTLQGVGASWRCWYLQCINQVGNSNGDCPYLCRSTLSCQFVEQARQWGRYRYPGEVETQGFGRSYQQVYQHTFHPTES